jgi:hypothetical protein
LFYHQRSTISFIKHLHYVNFVLAVMWDPGSDALYGSSKRAPQDEPNHGDASAGSTGQSPGHAPQFIPQILIPCIPCPGNRRKLVPWVLLRPPPSTFRQQRLHAGQGYDCRTVFSLSGGTTATVVCQHQCNTRPYARSRFRDHLDPGAKTALPWPYGPYNHKRSRSIWLRWTRCVWPLGALAKLIRLTRIMI